MRQNSGQLQLRFVSVCVIPVENFVMRNVNCDLLLIGQYTFQSVWISFTAVVSRVGLSSYTGERLISIL